ncbi:PAS domain-containing protein [Actinomycetospora rhizophila]|uniref:PAS domain-containing protein n=1 Tax=Actinomycetospora rhizophila TaxID=1416876 RepID=A0ABV9ZA50_9PSEU
MITNSDLSVVPQGAARTLLDVAGADTCERVAHRLSTGSLDRIRRVVLRLLARASVSDPATRTALQAEADELDAAVRAARDIIFSSAGPAELTEPRCTPAEPPVETALLDGTGTIVWVDEAWDAFCTANGGDPASSGVGRSYLALCDAAAATDGHSAAVAAAIRSALAGDLPAPTRVEVPCHAPTRPRFFDVLISSRRDDHGRVLGATVTLSEVVPAAV